ncbi:MAG TPA: crossover junction endodeoxyribonuclease RuvC [Verrucomicrobiae bacterium]|jgi:crossover junction endodeoxyribonuclease RuvC|nr:crossover junction endodeoxyribonuclease RuvC [Verrucomicrobiae bacterium]
MGITRRQFEQLQERASGIRRQPEALLISAQTHRAPTSHRVVLGIDPSLRGTGYGIIRWERPRPQLLAQGTIKTPSGWARSRCLLYISQTLRQVLQEHRPTVCAIEALFYAQNLQTALIMGEARGASLVAAAEAGVEIYEIAPRKVKQAIVGYGAAQKTAVARMVQRMLHLAELPAPDAADALALALTFAQETGRYNLSRPRPL